MRSKKIEIYDEKLYEYGVKNLGRIVFLDFYTEVPERKLIVVYSGSSHRKITMRVKGCYVKIKDKSKIKLEVSVINWERI